MGIMKTREMRRASITAHIGICVGYTLTQMHAKANVTPRIQAYLENTSEPLEIQVMSLRRTTTQALNDTVNDNWP